MVAGQTGEIKCTADLADFNTTGALQDIVEGNITISTESKTANVAVKMTVFELSYLGSFSQLIKDNQEYYWGALALIVAFGTLAFLGISGFFKPAWQQLAASIGGGGVAFLLSLAILL